MFVFPAFNDASGFKTADFDHLVKVFQLEEKKPVKLAYKLSHRVLFPGPIERQSVQLASAVFNDSTLQALRYYSTHGHPELQPTSEFVSIVLWWFKLINAKSTFQGVTGHDPDREAITPENIVEKTSFLRGFVDWLAEWEAHQGSGLSRETFQAAKHSSECIAALSEHLIEEKSFKYVLPIKFQNDKIEGRFGKIRQMCGGNIFASTRQFLESERSLRLMNLANLDLDHHEIKEIFSKSKQERDENSDELSHKIVSSVVTDSDFVELVPNIPSSDKDTLLYVTGSFARQLVLSTNCEGCEKLLLDSSPEPEGTLVSQSLSFISQVNRGRLSFPTELSFLVCCHAWQLYSAIINDVELKKLLHSPTASGRKVFTKALTKYFESSDETRLFFLDQTCSNGHYFFAHLQSFASKCFNVFTKNFVSELNSQIHRQKQRNHSSEQKRNPTDYKVTKLQSQTF